MRWASGSSTPVKETFGPRDVVGNVIFMIARENVMTRALSGTGVHVRSLRAPLPVADPYTVLHWLCAILRCSLVMPLLLLGGHASYPRFVAW